jgi:hypothetical protein
MTYAYMGLENGKDFRDYLQSPLFLAVFVTLLEMFPQGSDTIDIRDLYGILKDHHRGEQLPNPQPTFTADLEKGLEEIMTHPDHVVYLELWAFILWYLVHGAQEEYSRPDGKEKYNAIRAKTAELVGREIPNIDIDTMVRPVFVHHRDKRINLDNGKNKPISLEAYNRALQCLSFFFRKLLGKSLISY